jgi:hypothetical protein
LRTGRALSAEIVEINDFFNFPDLSDSNVTQLTVDSSNIFANMDYDGVFSPGINLSRLNIGIDLLHNRSAKQASLDLHTGWDDNSFLITLYTNVKQIALGINDSNNWVVNSDSIGKELAGLGLPVDEELKLDLGFLFPDVVDDEKTEDILIPAQDFFKSLKFSRSERSSYFSNNDGTVMTALICGSKLESLINDIFYSYYGSSETGAEIRQSIANISNADHELTLLINKQHIIQTAYIIVNVNKDSTVVLTAQLLGTENKLDHIRLDVKIGNDHNYNLYSLESKGQHIPVDNKIIGTTTISGFDSGEIQISYDIEKDRLLRIAAKLGSTEFEVKGILTADDDKIEVSLHTIDVEIYQFGAVYLSGDINITFGKASQEIRDITVDAYNIVDFKVTELYPLLPIVWDIVMQDERLFDIFGAQLFELIITSVFGEQFASYISDVFDENTEGLLDIVINLFGGWTDNAIEFFADLFTDILESDLPDKLGDMLGDLWDSLTDSLGGYISDWFSGLFGSPKNDDYTNATLP